jgi:hypothetical protein
MTDTRAQELGLLAKAVIAAAAVLRCRVLGAHRLPGRAG